MLRLVAASFIFVGAAAFIGWSAPPPSKKGGATAPASSSKSKSRAQAVRSKAGGKSAATMPSRRTVGRRSARRRVSDHYTFVGQQRPAPERIQEIEQALANKGFLSGSPDSVWDDATADALRRFQQSQNLTADGKLSSLSLIALGLGPRSTAAPSPAPPNSALPPAPPTTPQTPVPDR